MTSGVVLFLEFEVLEEGCGLRRAGWACCSDCVAYGLQMKEKGRISETMKGIYKLCARRDSIVTGSDEVGALRDSKNEI